jgi:hypothetical protein
VARDLHKVFPLAWFSTLSSSTERGDTSPMATFQGVSATKNGMATYGDVVEIGLLLPVNRAAALVELSRRRHQSVAQILRSLIDGALNSEANDDITS